MFQYGADVLRSCGWTAEYGNIPTGGCVADGLRLVCCPCCGDANEKGQSQARTFRRWYGRSEDGTKKGRDAEMIPKSQQKAVAKYNKKHYKQVLVQMNIETDADILSFLETLPSGEKAGFIRRAIREYIKILSL